MPASGSSADGTTLQDYWRKNPVGPLLPSDDELLQAKVLEKDPFGRLWHIAHIPVAWDDGSPTWKADSSHENWGLLWELLRMRFSLCNRRDSRSSGRSTVTKKGLSSLASSSESFLKTGSGTTCSIRSGSTLRPVHLLMALISAMFSRDKSSPPLLSISQARRLRSPTGSG